MTKHLVGAWALMYLAVVAMGAPPLGGIFIAAFAVLCCWGFARSMT
jgi:hypothetical protein